MAETVSDLHQQVVAVVEGHRADSVVAALIATLAETLTSCVPPADLRAATASVVQELQTAIAKTQVIRRP